MKNNNYDGIPKFYKDPLPNKKKELQKLYDELLFRLATSESGSRDYILTKEKINQILQKLSKRWTLKDYISILIGLIGIICGIIGLYYKKIL